MEGRFETFTVCIAGINRAIRKIKTEEMSEFCLKSPHVSCLHYLFRQGALTAKELCDLCDEDKASVSRSIDYLEKNGYIQCDSTAKKRYKAVFTLTEKGKVIGESISQKINTALDFAGKGLTDKQRVIMYESLARIHSNLSEFCKRYEKTDSALDDKNQPQ